jgi:protein-S-isoprenylcysteine O-methyltransferase Ste14
LVREKDWRVDIFPVIFFATVVALKTYYLVHYIVSNDRLWSLMQYSAEREAMGGKAIYYLTGQFSFIAYYFVSTAFDALVFYSLMVRRAAKDRPKGFWENIFPLVTVFVPVLGFMLMFVPQIRAVLPRYPESFLGWLAQITPAYPFYMNLGGLLIGLIGAGFSIWAIRHLRASFGLRTAVRELVTTGPYSRIRHPLYFGEMIHIFGVAILAATPVAMYLYIVAVVLQVIRAKVEERKFLASMPEYAEFRRNTGFLWPRLF